MSAPRTVAAATRRVFVLTWLRWLPVGLLTPVLVLLAQERGLSLAQVGLLFVVHGFVVAGLELPTGGIADVLGRRPVLLLSAVLHLLSCVLLLFATGLLGFAMVMLAKALGRSLDSGPLEAWYVDMVHQLDPAADVTPGLAWRAAADGGGLALGALLGGIAPALATGGGADALLVSVAAAGVLDVLYLVALLPLVNESRPPREGSLAQALREGAAQVPATVRGAVRLGVADRALRLILMLSFLSGVVLAGLELLGPLRFAGLAGGTDEGAALFGVVLAVSFAAAGVGAVSGPRVRSLLRGSTRAACAAVTAIGAVAVGLVAGPEAAVLAGGAYAVFYAANGAAWPLLHATGHGRVTASHRTTMLSAISLAVALGGVTASVVLPRVAELSSLKTGFLATAGAAALGGVLSLRLPRDEGTGRRPGSAGGRRVGTATDPFRAF